MSIETTQAPSFDWPDEQEMALDPYPTYARLREAGPVVYVPAFGCYLLTSHRAVVEAERRPELFSALMEDPHLGSVLGGRPMLHKDDPHHGVERNAINPTLRPRAISEVWSPLFARNVERFLDDLESIGPNDADLVRDFSLPVASQNLIDLLGFPPEVSPQQLARWSEDFIAGLSEAAPDPAVLTRCEASRAEVDAVLDELIPRLRGEANASLTSHLVNAGLSDEAIRSNVNLTISGGMNEPQHMITTTTWALLQHPSQLEAVRADPTKWGNVFEEAVRWMSPIGALPRITTADVEWEGVHIPAGSEVILMIACANHDETVYGEGDQFQITRNARGHVAFGSGVHQCAGRWAAKASVGELAVPMLFERFPSLSIAEDRPSIWHGWDFRGLKNLAVTW